MGLFDTHCHFECGDANEIAAQLTRAKQAGVEKIMVVGGSAALNQSALIAVDVSRGSVAGLSPEVVVALGFDRDQTTRATDAAIDELDARTVREGGPWAAWGEIGLDYHYSPETRVKQMDLFAKQLEQARARDLPVVIHTREATDDTVALLTEIPGRGIIHSFTGTGEEAKRFLDLGYFVSLSGIVTFKAAQGVREMARVIPDDRLLIETDAPYLAPVPMRGHTNEPAFLRHTCEFLARERGMSAEALADLTFANAERILQ